MEDFIVVFITAPSVEDGEKIARFLVEQRLAACVNMIPQIHSVYHWEGQVEQESEALLIVKTKAKLFETHLIPAVQRIHPYKVPEIIAVPIQAGLPAYLNWINQETQ